MLRFNICRTGRTFISGQYPMQLMWLPNRPLNHLNIFRHIFFKRSICKRVTSIAHCKDHRFPSILTEILYKFHPANGWVKFVKYLRENGWEPVIFTVSNGSYPLTDASLKITGS